MIFDPVIPPSWIIAIAIVAVVLTARTHWLAGHRLGKIRNGFLTICRLLALLAVISLLLQPSEEE